MTNIKEFFDAKSANWDSHQIHDEKFFANFVKTYLPIKKGMHVLDIGCGTGIITKHIYNLSKSKVIGLDISHKMIEIAKSKNNIKDITFVSEDFLNTNIKDIDMIVAHNCYSFFNQEKFKKKCLEVLNPHGIVAIVSSRDRKWINHHFETMEEDIGRHVNGVDEEYEIFKDRFELVNNKDEEVYIMVMKLR